MIPEAAVEAAADIVRQAQRGYLTPERAVRYILEAAAPHMLRDAWNEGHGAGQIDPYCLNGNPHDPRDRTAK